ncbi:MAG: hypothetical protein JST11_19350 [Acidobacteria bacterium]|nr:hypothetical protein [Acidobacteriota bacterium]
MKKWSVFAAAVVFVGYLLISRGAPPVPVLCGIGLAALFTLRKTQSA